MLTIDANQDPALGPWRRTYWFAVGAVLLLGLLLRTVPLTYSHYWDETVYLQHAKIILDGRTNYDEFDYRPPLLPFFYAFGFALWNHIYVANLVQGTVSALSVLFGFLYVRRAFGDLPALVSAVLFAFTPYFVGASHSLLTDVPAVALMLAAMWLFDRPGSGSPLFAGVACALAAQMRFTSLFVLAYFAANAVFAEPRLRRLAYLLAGLGATIGPYLIWVRWHYGGFFHAFAHSRRITNEWTMPVPLSFYFEALGQIFPASLWLFFVAGILFSIAHSAWRERTGPGTGLLSGIADFDAKTGRVLALLGWGVGFLVYMLTIPHKEVRYLLPLAIPVVVISALGIADICRWVARRGNPMRAFGLLLAIAVAAADYAPAFAKLARPWVDASETETVQIANFVREISTPADTLYATHEFPVLAYYSELRTLSLLPIQEDFDRAWRNAMKEPGYLVYYHPVGIKETHSRNPSFKPDQAFLEASPNFRAVRVFPHATVYRYDPKS